MRSSLSIRRSLAWSFSLQFWQAALQFITSIIIARLLTPQEVGVFALALAAYIMIAALKDFGIGSYLIREEELTDDKVRTAFGLSIAIFWMFGLVVLSIRHTFADFYGVPGIAQVLALISVSFFLMPFDQPANALLRREMKFDTLHHIEFAATVIGSAVSIVLALYGLSYMALGWGYVAAAVSRPVLFLFACPSYVIMKPSLRHWREVLSFGGWLAAGTLFGTAGDQGAKMIISGLLDPAALALFQRASQIPKTMRRFSLAPVGIVLLPAFSKALRENKPISTKLENLIGTTTIILWPAFFVFSFLSEPLILILYGENWIVAGKILPFLLIAATINTMFPQIDLILIPKNKIQRLFYVRITQFFIAIIVAWIGASYGLEEFARLRIVAMILFAILIYTSINDLLEISINDLLRIYIKSFSTAIFCSTPQIYLFTKYYNNISILFILISLILSFFIWLFMVYSFNKFLTNEFVRIYRKISPFKSVL